MEEMEEMEKMEEMKEKKRRREGGEGGEREERGEAEQCFFDLFFYPFYFRRWKMLGRRTGEDVNKNPELFSLLPLPYTAVVPGGR